MFRCQAVLWAMLAWTMIFSYTMLTYAGVGHIYQTIPIVALFFIIVLLNSLLCHVAHRTKTLLLFSTWCAFLLLAILLRTWSIITDWHLNLIVSIFTLIASVVWLIAGHVEDVTESGLYWHVWSLLSIFSVLCAFNNDSQTAIIIYAVNTGILCVTHMLYIRHIVITQTQVVRGANTYSEPYHAWSSYSHCSQAHSSTKQNKLTKKNGKNGSLSQKSFCS